MARSSDLKLGATVFQELAPRYSRELLYGATVSPNRVLEMSTSTGKLSHATAGSRQVVGASPGAVTGSSGKSVGPFRGGVAWGPCVLTADQAIVASQRIKAGNDGKAIQLVDSTLSGTTIKVTSVGSAFTNQPANDGVEVVSSSAGDTTQTATVIGTTTGTDTVVVETVALNGTTFVPTVKTDWGVVLAVKLSASCAGTVTFREASADQTITTITTGNLSKGVDTVSSSGTTQYAYNVAPTAVADGATTKQIGIQGTNSAGTVIYSSKALNGATAVTFASAFKTVTEVYTGDVENTRTETVKVGAAEDDLLEIGKALEAATASGSLFNALLIPR